MHIFIPFLYLESNSIQARSDDFLECGTCSHTLQIWSRKSISECDFPIPSSPHGRVVNSLCYCGVSWWFKFNLSTGNSFLLYWIGLILNLNLDLFQLDYLHISVGPHLKPWIGLDYVGLANWSDSIECDLVGLCYPDGMPQCHGVSLGWIGWYKVRQWKSKGGYIHELLQMQGGLILSVSECDYCSHSCVFLLWFLVGEQFIVVGEWPKVDEVLQPSSDHVEGLRKLRHAHFFQFKLYKWCWSS